VKLRDKLRSWLGLPAIEQVLLSVPSLVMFQAMEKKQAERHEQLLGAVNKLTLTLQNAHAFDKPTFAPPVLDWETVQAMALHALENESDKERN
jgi:hypothetical protein